MNYINRQAEVSQLVTPPLADNQTVEGNSGSPGYKSQVLSTFALCGGTKTVFNEQMFEPSFIETPEDPSLIMVHGTSDQLIPVVRSLEVELRANEISLPNLYFTLEDAQHCPWFFPLENSWTYLDSLISFTVPFFHAQEQNKVIASTDKNFKG